MEWLAFRMVPWSAKHLTKRGKVTSFEHPVTGNESVLPVWRSLLWASNKRGCWNSCQNTFRVWQVWRITPLPAQCTTNSRIGPFLRLQTKGWWIQWNFGAQDRPWAEQTIPSLAERVGNCSCSCRLSAKRCSKILSFLLVWPLGLCAR